METSIDTYLRYLKETKRLSDNTISSYRRDLVAYLNYLEGQRIPLEKVKRSNIVNYEIMQQKSGKSNASIARMLASIRGYHQYLYLIGVTAKNPSAGIESPKQERKLPGILTVKEVDLLLSQPVLNNYKGYRDKAMLELLYATGIRVSELIGLQVKDVDFKHGLIRCHGEDKERYIPFGAICSDALQTYINLSPYHRDQDPEQLLFTNLNGKQMSRQGFWKIIKRYKQQAGIEKEITPQVLRHSFAAHLMDNGVDLKSLQELMGHAAISSTQVYDELTHNRLREIYKKTHPRA